MPADRSRTTWTARVTISLSSLLLLSALYFGAYRLTVEPSLSYFAGNKWQPVYRFRPKVGNTRELLESFFMPAHLVDRKLRPKRWNHPPPVH